MDSLAMWCIPMWAQQSSWQHRTRYSSVYCGITYFCLHDICCLSSKNMLFCKKMLCSVKKYVVLQILSCSAKRCLVLQRYVVLPNDVLFCKKICCSAKRCLVLQKLCCSAKRCCWKHFSYNVNFIVTLQHITQLKTTMAFCFVGSA